jgi:septum site-determining protein MinD
VGKSFLVTSGKGGTGKTTVAAGLSVCLAALGRQVVCVDADVGLRNLDLVLGLTDHTALDFQDVLTGTASLREALCPHPLVPGLFFLPAPVTVRGGRLEQAAFNEMIHVLQDVCDYCFVDCAAGLSAGFSLVAASCDHALVISALELPALRDAARTIEALERHRSPKTWLVVNRLRPKTVDRPGGINVDDAMDLVGLPLLGLIPEDVAVMDAVAQGLPLPLLGRTGAGQAMHDMALRLEGHAAPVKPRRIQATY